VRPRWTAGALAALVLLAPLKFGVPVVVQHAVPPPGAWLEWLWFSWPNPLLILLAFGALIWTVPLVRRRGLLLSLPALFLATQLATWPGSVNGQASSDTVAMFAVYVLVCHAAATVPREHFARVAGGLAAAVVVVCLVALHQYCGGLAATAAMFPAVSPEVAGKLAARRVFGTLVTPNALAGFIVIAFGPALAWLWGRRWRWLALVVAGLMLTCLVLTGSRGGLLALGVAAVAVVLAGRSRRMLGLAGVGLLVVVGAAVVSGRARFGGQSVAARWDYWQGAARIIRDHPWRGTGPGTFGSMYPVYKTAPTEEAQAVHNDFLQIWSDSGVAAFAVFVALWAAGLRAAYRLPRDPVGLALAASLTGWVAHGLVDFDLYIPGVAVPAFVLLGTVQGWSAPVGPAVGRRWGVAAAGVLLAVVVWWKAPALAAAFPYGRARETGDLAAAETAARWQPANAHYWATAGDCAWAAGQLDRALEHYRRAAACDPYRAAYRWRWARALWAAGRRAEAVAMLRRAVELNPTHAGYRRELQAAVSAVR